jgi:D-amino-acid dehydrogenase
VACARELSRRGAGVVLLERGALGSGCSYGNAGWLTPSLAVPLPAPGMVRKALGWLLDPESPLRIEPRASPELASWLLRFLAATGRRRYARGARALVELCRSSVEEYERLSRDGGPAFGFERRGMLALSTGEEGLAALRAHARTVGELGVAWRELTAGEARELEPALRGPLAGAVLFPEDAHCEPLEAVLALAADAEHHGARLLDAIEVLDFELTAGRVAAVATSRGRFAADAYVLAAGGWSRGLGRRLGLRLPVLGGKGYAAVLPPLAVQPRRPLMLAERKVAITPRRDGLRVAGTLELVLDCDLSLTTRRLAAILEAAGRVVELPDRPELVEVWRGLRPCTPDGLPLLGRARGLANLWLATGHQMTGLKTAPASARLLAELMLGEPPSFDPAPFRADRY